jgi:tRNA A58 N-methylase Trm61
MAVTFAPTIDDLRRELQRHERALHAFEILEFPYSARPGDMRRKHEIMIGNVERARAQLAAALTGEGAA